MKTSPFTYTHRSTHQGAKPQSHGTERKGGTRRLLLMFLLKGHKPEKFLERQETNINLNSDAIRRFFERAATQPLGPPAITGDLGRLVVEAQ